MSGWLGGQELMLLAFRIFTCCIFLSTLIPCLYIFDCVFTRIVKMCNAYGYVMDYVYHRKEFKIWLKEYKK